MLVEQLRVKPMARIHPLLEAEEWKNVLVPQLFRQHHPFNLNRKLLANLHSFLHSNLVAFGPIPEFALLWRVQRLLFSVC